MVTKSNKQTAEVAVIKGEAPAPRRSREAIMADVCAELERGVSLDAACKVVGDARASTVLDWVDRYPTTLGEEYARARTVGYRLLADQIVSIADETSTEVEVQEVTPEGLPVFNEDGSPVLKRVRVPLSADVIARNRLRVDTRKWMLSKMLPKVYGDKVTQEITGADGGAIQVAAVSLKGLNDNELEQMKQLMTKASNAPK